MKNDTLAQDFALAAYTTYGQYVVGNRAVADYRDGLKPVQRRILWAMYKLGLKHGSKFTKSANTVGTVLAHYHPHGDSSVYDALVGLVNCRYPLVEGKGNFGSATDPDAPAAAYRYTEARLHALADLAVGSDDSIIETQKNFDDQLVEPVILASELPFLLLNGCSGIAVGIVSEIPPHNLQEIVNVCCEMLADKTDSYDLDAALTHVRGPDYGHSVLTSPVDAVRALYETGEGSLSFRCEYKFDNNQLVITSYAPRFNRQKFIETCAQYIEAGNLLYCTDKSSKKDGIRLVVGYQNARFVNDHVLPLLDTSVSYRFFVNETKADGARTHQFGLIDILERWLAWRVKNEKAIIRSDIAKIERKATIIAAKRLGAQHIQKIAKILVSDVDNIETAVVTALKCSHEAAGIILDTPLRQLAKLQVEQLDKEIASLQKQKQASEDALKNARSIVSRKLKESVKGVAGDRRGTLVGVRRPRLDLPAEDSLETYVACSRDGKIMRLEGSPDQRRGSMKAWDQIVQTGTYVWVVDASGQMQRLEVASLAVNKPKSFDTLAGIASSSAQRIVLMDENGDGLVLDAGSLLKDKYQGMRSEHRIVRAAGMKNADDLLVWNKKASYVHKSSELQTTRVNSGGWKLLPKYKTGAEELLVVKEGKWVRNEQGKNVYGAAADVNMLNAVSGRCYVEWSDGQKAVTTLKEIVGSGKQVQKLIGIE